MADTQHDKLEKVCQDISATTNNNIIIEQSICDVTNEAQVQDALRKADELIANQPASILVNSAGITRDGLTSNLSDKDWDSVIDVNLKGTFLMCKAFFEPNRINSLLMGSRIGGSIINIGSIVSNYGNVGQVNYAGRSAALVLFHHVNSCVQYEASTRSLLHLTLFCLYLIAFASRVP